MTAALIGNGAISAFVRRELAARNIPVTAVVVRAHKVEKLRAEFDRGVVLVSSILDLPDGVTLVADCAGHSALAEHGPVALAAGKDVITVSIGALADPALSAELEAAAKAGGSRLHLASGAIGALDVLRSAKVGRLVTVRYTGRKPPASWAGSAAEEKLDLTSDFEGPQVHFTGSAREAALRYPKNANVAAAVALAGIGFDETRVRLIADPGVSKNIHEIEAEGDFGTLRFSVSGNSLPDNPRSSALAAMSVIASVVEAGKAIGF